MTFSGFLRISVPLMLLCAALPAFAQDPTGLSISPPSIYLPPAASSCYTIYVGNGANMTTDIKYRLNSGVEQTIDNWPDLDAGGQRYVCTDSATALGTYTFTAVRRHGSANWLAVNASVTVSAAPSQPSSLTFNGASVSSGYAGNDFYLLHAGNAASMALDLDYTINDVPQSPATLTLNSGGDWSYTLSHFDQQGTWRFLRMKNHLRSDWMNINSTYTILPPKPTSAFVSPASVIAGQGAYVWTVGNGANTTLDIQYTLTTNGTEGQLLRINGWPQLAAGNGAEGLVTVPVGPCTALGTYRFKWIKNTANPDFTAIAMNTAVTVTAPPAPAVTDTAPITLKPGTSSALLISGSNLCGVTLSSSSPSLSFSAIPDDFSSTGTGIQTIVNVASDATPGLVTVQVAGRGGTTTFPFYISSSAPPTITGITPASAGPGNTQLTLTGTNLIGATLNTSWYGLSFSNYSYGATGTTLGARVTVAASAPGGTATLAVMTPAGSAAATLAITASGSGISSVKEYIYLGDRALAVESASAQPSPPGPPTQLSGQAMSPYTAQLQWQPAAAAPGLTISSYQIKRGATVIATVPATQLSYLDTSALPETAYSYRAVARDNWAPTPQNSVDSNTATVTTPRETIPPTAPTNVTIPSSGDAWVELTWSASIDSGGSGLAGYYVYFTGVGDPISSLVTETFFFVDFSWWPDADWSFFQGFEVVAVDHAGNVSQPGRWP